MPQQWCPWCAPAIGWQASRQTCFPLVCDPPNPEWTRLLDAYKAYSAGQRIDLCVGRRTHHLFRAAGVVDIHVDAIVPVYPAGDHGRMILVDFVNNVREKLIGFSLRRDTAVTANRPLQFSGEGQAGILPLLPLEFLSAVMAVHCLALQTCA
jgi:hypothetical protein